MLGANNKMCLFVYIVLIAVTQQKAIQTPQPSLSTKRKVIWPDSDEV